VRTGAGRHFLQISERSLYLCEDELRSRSRKRERVEQGSKGSERLCSEVGKKGTSPRIASEFCGQLFPARCAKFNTFGQNVLLACMFLTGD